MSSSVEIAGNLSLGTGNLVIAATNFTLDAGKTVTTSGAITVFAHDNSYNIEDASPYQTRSASITSATARRLSGASVTLVAFSSDAATVTDAVKQHRWGRG